MRYVSFALIAAASFLPAPAAEDGSTAAPQGIWLRPSGPEAPLVWGRRDGIVFGLPSRGGLPGPRGLVRVGVFREGQSAPDLVNFIAFEPVVGGRKGFSELEASRLDDVQGKRLSVIGPVEGELQERADQEELVVAVECEPFENGAAVRAELVVSSKAPAELRIRLFDAEGSAHMEENTVTATMGNYGRLRRVTLADRWLDSRRLFEGYSGEGFVEHSPYPLGSLPRLPSGDVMVAAVSDEEEPAAVKIEGLRAWQYRSDPLTHYWRVPAAEVRPDLRLRLNGRRVYWQTHRVIPGGIAFENFELRSSFVPGQTFIFGLSRSSPAELGVEPGRRVVPPLSPKPAPPLPPTSAPPASGQPEALTPRLVFSDSLWRPNLDAGWVVDASPGNSVEVRGGALEIRADRNTYAHIERRLGVDLVRASSEIESDPAMSWCASVFLYWDSGSWCQMGPSGHGGGKLYACEMLAGVPLEHVLSPCPLARYHRVAIELAEDCIRFLSGTDDGSWRVELTSPRDEALRGPPALLIVGKGYGRGTPEYPRPDLDNDYGDRGPPGVSRVRRVVVTRTEHERLRAGPEESRRMYGEEEDILGASELAAPEDPSFESVSSHFPAMKRPREAVGVPEHPDDIGIAPDGTLQLSSEVGAASSPQAFFEVGSPPTRFGSGPGGASKRMLVEDADVAHRGFDGVGSVPSRVVLPEILATFVNDGLRYEETVHGWSRGMSADTPLSAYVSLSIENPGPQDRVVPVQFRVVPETAGRPSLRWELRVPAGGSERVRLRVPYRILTEDAQEVDAAEAFLARHEFQAHWQEFLSRGMRLEIPEPRVQEAWQAWLVYSALCIDKVDGRLEPHDGTGFYELVYGYSAALHVNALDLWGRHADARRYAESLLELQDADGLFTSNFGTPDSGALLLALTEHYRLTGDADWLSSVASRMSKMCDWVARKRRESMAPPGVARPVTHGLVYFRPYCDHGPPAYDYFGDAYLATGLERTAQAFSDAGLSEEAARIAVEAASYRSDILASMEAAAIERGGMKILPMEPDTRRLLRGSGYKAGGYYGLIASCLLESGFLPALDVRTRWVTDFLERRGGLILGMCEFDGGVDHAYTYGYWLNCLEKDEPKKVILGFYGALTYGMSRGTWAGVEVTRLETGENEPTLPHLYSSTQQLRILRLMLLREDGDMLLVGQAIPRRWLEPGKRIAVWDAPTGFGPVSFVITSEAGRIVIDLCPPARRPPRGMRLRLRLPLGKDVTRATLDGKPIASVRGEDIAIPTPSGPVRIVAEF